MCDVLVEVSIAGYNDDSTIILSSHFGTIQCNLDNKAFFDSKSGLLVTHKIERYMYNIVGILFENLEIDICKFMLRLSNDTKMQLIIRLSSEVEK